MPKTYSSGEWFRVKTLYWNIGVNHEATLAITLGDITLEESINMAALSIMSSVVFSGNNNEKNETLINMFNDLKKTVTAFSYPTSNRSISRYMSVHHARILLFWPKYKLSPVN